MRKSKKYILIAVVVAVALAGSLVGVAFAQEGTGDTGQPKTLLARVATILGIEQQTLEDAVAQAQKEMRDEQLDNYLDKLVENDKITQEQADQYKSWWQSRPDAPLKLEQPGFGRFPRMGGFRGWCGPGQFSVPPQTSPSTTQ